MKGLCGSHLMIGWSVSQRVCVEQSTFTVVWQTGMKCNGPDQLQEWMCRLFLHAAQFIVCRFLCPFDMCVVGCLMTFCNSSS